MHTAIYDAVVAIHHSATPYLRPCTCNARAPRRRRRRRGRARHARAPLPRAAALDRRSSTRRPLAQCPRRRPQDPRASASARLAAAQLLAQPRRATAPAPRPLAFTPDLRPGDYQLTPPAFAPPVFTHWPHVTAVRPAPREPVPAAGRRRALTSPKYAAALNEVKRLGAATGSTRTADQTQIGLFWNPPIWATWNRIAADRCARAPRRPVAERAHVRGAEPDVRRLHDRVLRREVHLPPVAAGDRDPAGRHATATPTRSPIRRGRRCRTPRPTPPTPAPTRTISAAGADVLRRVYGNDFALHRDVDGAARASCARSRASPRPRTRRASAASTTATTRASTRPRREPRPQRRRVRAAPPVPHPGRGS